MKLRLLIGAALLLCVPSWADEMVDHSFGHTAAEKEAQMVFHLSLDGTCSPALNTFGLKQVRNSITRYVEGHLKGSRAAVVDGRSCIELTSSGPFLKGRGSIAFWCRPLNWNGYSKGASVMAAMTASAAKGYEGALWIYADSRTPKNLFVSVSRKNGFAEPEKKASKIGGLVPISAWGAENHHVVYTFDERRLCLYVDGRKLRSAASDEYRIPGGLDRLLIGGMIPPWCGKDEGSQTAIEDFRIYDRALSEEEVSALAAIGNPEIRSRGRFKSELLVEIPLRTAELPPNDDASDALLWSSANLISGLLDNHRRRVASRQSDIALFHTRTGLHFLIDTPNAVESEKFRLLLHIPGKGPRQFILPGKDIPVKKTFRNGHQTLVVFIPFATLGVACPAPGTVWRWNLLRGEGETLASLVPLWDPEVSWNELETGELRFAAEDAPVVRMNQMQGLQEKAKPFSMKIAFREGKDSGKLFVFADTYHAGRMSRAAFSENCRRDTITSWSIDSTRSGAGSLKDFDKVRFQMMNRKFNAMYYRSEWLPKGDAPALTTPILSLEKNAGLLRAVSNASGMPPSLIRDGKVRSRLLVDDKVVSEKVSSAILPEMTASFPISLLPVGKEYTLNMDVLDSVGFVRFSTSAKGVLPDVSSWLGNRRGISSKVPAPFEPVRVQGRQFLCWNRGYDFDGGSLLPVGITSAGRQLLASPVRICGKSQGREFTFASGEWSILRKDDTEVKYRAVATSRGLRAVVTGRLEFDGMMAFNMEISSSSGASLEELKIVVPVRAEHASLFGFTESTGAGQGSSHFYGNAPKEVTWYPFRPFFWLGDTDRGLLVFAESARNWVRSAPERAVSVEPSRGATSIILHLVSRNTSLASPRAYAFGLQAGPVRPRPTRWRELETLYCFGPTNPKFYGYVPNASELALKTFEKARREKKLVSAYSFLNNVSTALPEYNLFFDEWRSTEGQKKGEFYLDRVAPDVPSWQDFIVNSYFQGMEKHGLAGIYYDLAWPSPTKNQAHGGFINEFGAPENAWPIFAVRTIARRAYTAFRERRAETLFVGHVSSNPIVLPIISFCDLLLDGEQFAGILTSYTRQIPPERGMAEFTARPFGPPLMFLPELSKSGNAGYSARTEAPTEEMLGILYLHDMLLWPLFCNSRAVQRFRTPFTRFVQGADVEFLPYWEKHGIAATHSDVRIGAYRKPGALLAAVVNQGDKDVVTDISLPGAYSHVVDAVSGKPTGLRGVSIPAKSLRLFLLTE